MPAAVASPETAAEAPAEVPATPLSSRGRILVWLLVAGFAVVILSLSSAFSYLAVRNAAEWRIPFLQDLLRTINAEETQKSKDFLRENLNAMAVKLGEMQAQLTRLDALGERLSSLAGYKPQDFRFGEPPGLGGATSTSLPPQNLSLREFLQSDWTMLNPRLALHYGLPAAQGADFQRVTLRPEDRRGGLLTHASVLSLTSDGVRHRPVHRGVWVSEAIFGKTPPPPPPNVEPLEPTPSNSPKATIRMQLEAHATNPTCAACHRKIDPLGFAFDNFDAIGRWRTHEAVATGQGDNPAVNPAGTLPNGAAFTGPDDFKRLLAADLPRFAEAFNNEGVALKELGRAGLVSQERQGRHLIYRASFDQMNGLLAYLSENCCGGNPCTPVAVRALKSRVKVRQDL